MYTTYFTFILLMLTVYTSYGFIHQIDMTHSAEIILSVEQYKPTHIQLYNFHLPANKKLLNFYCETMPANSEVTFNNIKKNGPSVYPEIQRVLPSRFDYIITEDENNWQTLDFDVVYTGTQVTNVRIICWMNGDFTLRPYHLDMVRVTEPITIPPQTIAFVDFTIASPRMPTTSTERDPQLDNQIELISAQIQLLSTTKNLGSNEQLNEILNTLTNIARARSYLEEHSNLDENYYLDELNALDAQLNNITALYQSSREVPIEVKTTPTNTDMTTMPKFSWNDYPMLLNPATQQPFNNPVIIAEGADRGKTVEYNKELSGKSIYPNLLLQKIINILRSLGDQWDEHTKKEIMEAITCDIVPTTMFYPLTFTEGQSLDFSTYKSMMDYSSANIVRNPFISQDASSQSQVVPNFNLQDFVIAFTQKNK